MAYALFNPAGIADDLLTAIREGQPVIALKRVKRQGIVTMPGEVVPNFGSSSGDDFLAREGMVITKELYDAQKQKHVSDEYNRDVLAPVEARALQAASAHEQQAANVARLKSQLKDAQDNLKAAEKARETAEAAYAEAQQKAVSLFVV